MRRTGLVQLRSPFIKRLTQAEIEERRSKGLCFNFDERSTPGHHCKKLFWLEVMEDSNETEETEMENTEEAEISIHAIIGMQFWQTMQIGVSLKGYPLLILIDSGSTHSFWMRLGQEN